MKKRKLLFLFENIGGKQAGFTLVELMIALALGGLVLGFVYSAFQAQQKSYTIQDQVAGMQGNIRAALNYMARDIRLAGYNPTELAGPVITEATSTKFQFKVYDVLTGNLETLGYKHYDTYDDGDMGIGRIMGGATNPLAEDVPGLEFNYILENGSKTLTPAVADIRGVEITLLARTDKPDANFTDNQTYTAPGLTAWDYSGASADHYRKRLVTMTVMCRNLGM